MNAIDLCWSQLKAFPVCWTLSALLDAAHGQSLHLQTDLKTLIKIYLNRIVSMLNYGL